jgi:hypothetical protein
MDPDALEIARSRYRAAYAAYLERARRVAEKIDNGLAPSVEDVMEEANATEELAVARRELLDAMAKMVPTRP